MKEHPPSGLRVLVVEDYPDQARTLAVLVSIWGHQVRSASDGLSALEVASTFFPHVVLLDIGLPQIHGYEVAKRIREIAELKESLLIATTGHADLQASTDAGIDLHLLKPFNPVELQGILARAALLRKVSVPQMAVAGSDGQTRPAGDQQEPPERQSKSAKPKVHDTILDASQPDTLHDL